MNQHDESGPQYDMRQTHGQLSSEPQKEEMSATGIRAQLQVTESALRDLEQNLDRLSQKLMPTRVSWEEDPTDRPTINAVEIPRSELAERIGRLNNTLWTLGAAVHRMTEEVDL